MHLSLAKMLHNEQFAKGIAENSMMPSIYQTKWQKKNNFNKMAKSTFENAKKIVATTNVHKRYNVAMLLCNKKHFQRDIFSLEPPSKQEHKHNHWFRVKIIA